MEQGQIFYTSEDGFCGGQDLLPPRLLLDGKLPRVPLTFVSPEEGLCTVFEIKYQLFGICPY